MIRLSRLADYSVVAMTHIANRPDRQFTAAELAADTGLPAATVSKILKALSHGGLLVSQRGAKGGYTLARPAEEIAVSEIVAAVDGPIALTDCAARGDSGCIIEPLCPTSAAWKKINAVINEALRDLTLADLTAPVFTFPPPVRAKHPAAFAKAAEPLS